MDIDIKEVSLFGMAIQRTRIEAASVNIAIAQLVFSQENMVTQPLQALTNLNDFSALIGENTKVDLAPIKDAGVKALYKPEHAMANEQGYIFKPNINVASEMLILNEATRAYEANVKAFNTYREMSAKAMEIGK